MSYFPTIDEMAAEAERWDSLSPEERKKETATQIAKEVASMKERERAEEEAARLRQEAVVDVKSRAGMFCRMVDKAYNDKDTIRYVYGVAALFIINHLELGIKEMATDDIRSVLPESVPVKIGLGEMEYLNRICLCFGGNAHIDLVLHEDVNISNYSLHDLVGCAIRSMKKPTEVVFDLFRNNLK